MSVDKGTDWEGIAKLALGLIVAIVYALVSARKSRKPEASSPDEEEQEEVRPARAKGPPAKPKSAKGAVPSVLSTRGEAKAARPRSASTAQITAQRVQEAISMPPTSFVPKLTLNRRIDPYGRLTPLQQSLILVEIIGQDRALGPTAGIGFAMRGKYYLTRGLWMR